MFLIFNKEKIISYVIAFSTVVILLFVSGIAVKQQDTVTTMSNVILKQDNNLIQKNIICGE